MFEYYDKAVLKHEELSAEYKKNVCAYQACEDAKKRRTLEKKIEEKLRPELEKSGLTLEAATLLKLNKISLEQIKELV